MGLSSGLLFHWSKGSRQAKANLNHKTEITPLDKRLEQGKKFNLKEAQHRLLQLAQIFDSLGRDRRQPQIERQKVPSIK